MDPVLYKGNSATMFWNQAMYDSFIYVGRDGSLNPGLALSWDTPDDNTLNLHLRPNVLFQDGTTFDANAVKVNWDRVMAKKAQGSTAILSMQSVTAVDPLTVQVKFSQPLAGSFIIGDLTNPKAIAIVSPTALAKYGDAGIDGHPVGAGPYQFALHDHNQRVVLQRFPDYWNKNYQAFGGWEIDNLPPGAATVAALTSGQVDAAIASTGDLSTLKAQGLSVTQGTFQAGYQTFLALSPCGTNDPFKSVVARQALGYAINRSDITNGSSDGRNAVVTSIMAPDQPFYSAADDPKYTFDTAKAKSLLAQAGVAPGTQVTLLNGDQTPSVMEPAAQIIQAELKDAGLSVKLVNAQNFTAELKNKPEIYLSSVPQGSLSSSLFTGAVLNPCGNGTPDLTAAVTATQSLSNGQAGIAKAWATTDRLNAAGGWLIPIMNMPEWWVNTKNLSFFNRPLPSTASWSSK
jgi:peptide/nickel transport system substrate-binding protein